VFEYFYDALCQFLPFFSRVSSLNVQSVTENVKKVSRLSSVMAVAIGYTILALIL
jgi:hypothetical protein